MLTINQILTKYWGYTTFRPFQEDIINSVIANKDTLALLPTGGGKSVCYQIPALYNEGICIVVSPLIALMKDQVNDLIKRDIKAIAITSELHKREIDIALENCIYGKVKFLYLSPERLQTDIVKERVKKMKVNLIAVDEAHCISQWGYDFRPSYLKIKELRELLPKTPILALTATATNTVAKDICKQLLFKTEHIIKGSYKRPNLSYSVITDENKIKKIISIINKVSGSGIIYVRTRKKSEAIYKQLQAEKISSAYFHAGLIPAEKDKRMQDWLLGKSQIMVATNAFGMGINKPNVRLVIHADIPESPEAYFQEAGRAGRDEKKAYAVLMSNESNKLELEKYVISSFPTLEQIKQTYHALANYYKLAIGIQNEAVFNFDIADFCSTYQLNAVTVYNSLRFLEKENYISLTENINRPAKIFIPLNKEQLYQFQVSNPHIDPFIKLLLRSYTGLFDGFVNINESDLAKRYDTSRDKIISMLTMLANNNIVNYISQSTFPQLSFNNFRVNADAIQLSNSNFSDIKLNAIKRMEWMLYYINSHHKCRSQLLLSYFDEQSDYRCGICDICLERNKLELSSYEFELVSEQIKKITKQQSLPLQSLTESIQQSKHENIVKVIRWLLDNGKLYYEQDKLKWRS